MLNVTHQKKTENQTHLLSMEKESIAYFYQAYPCLINMHIHANFGVRIGSKHSKMLKAALLCLHLSLGAE